MRQLTGILRAGQFIAAEPWATPWAYEGDDEVAQNQNRLTDRFTGLSERIERERRAAVEPDQALPLAEARQLIDAVRGVGFTIALGADGKVQVRGTGKLPDSTVERLRQHRNAIARLLEAEGAR